MLTIFLANSSLDLSKFSSLNNIDCKCKDNMITKIIGIKSLSKLIDPTSKILFFSKMRREFIYMVICNYYFIGDQASKRNYTNSTCGNSSHRECTK